MTCGGQGDKSSFLLGGKGGRGLPKCVHNNISIYPFFLFKVLSFTSIHVNTRRSNPYSHINFYFDWPITKNINIIKFLGR
jgi:hypothetical protein